MLSVFSHSALLFTAFTPCDLSVSQECSEASYLLGIAASNKGHTCRAPPIWSLAQSNPIVLMSHKNFIFAFLFGAYTHLQTLLEQLYKTALHTWRRGLPLPGDLWAAMRSGITLCFASSSPGWMSWLEVKSVRQDYPMARHLFFRRGCQISWLAQQTLQPDHCHIQGMISRSTGPSVTPFGDICGRPSKVSHSPNSFSSYGRNICGYCTSSSEPISREPIKYCLVFSSTSNMLVAPCPLEKKGLEKEGPFTSFVYVCIYDIQEPKEWYLCFKNVAPVFSVRLGMPEAEVMTISN